MGTGCLAVTFDVATAAAPHLVRVGPGVPVGRDVSRPADNADTGRLNVSRLRRSITRASDPWHPPVTDLT